MHLILEYKITKSNILLKYSELNSKERKRDRETERQRDRETERQRDRETEGKREREREKEGT